MGTRVGQFRKETFQNQKSWLTLVSTVSVALVAWSLALQLLQAMSTLLLLMIHSLIWTTWFTCSNTTQLTVLSRELLKPRMVNSSSTAKPSLSIKKEIQLKSNGEPPVLTSLLNPPVFSPLLKRLACTCKVVLSTSSFPPHPPMLQCSSWVSTKKNMKTA